jgi:hypothetical protein
MFLRVFNNGCSAVRVWLKVAQRVVQFTVRLDRDVASVFAPHKARDAAGFDISAVRVCRLDQSGERFAVSLGCGLGIPIVTFASVTDCYPSCHVAALCLLIVNSKRKSAGIASHKHTINLA